MWGEVLQFDNLQKYVNEVFEENGDEFVLLKLNKWVLSVEIHKVGVKIIFVSGWMKVVLT